jgi:hypothetical protein
MGTPRHAFAVTLAAPAQEQMPARALEMAQRHTQQAGIASVVAPTDFLQTPIFCDHHHMHTQRREIIFRRFYSGEQEACTVALQNEVSYADLQRKYSAPSSTEPITIGDGVPQYGDQDILMALAYCSTRLSGQRRLVVDAGLIAQLLGYSSLDELRLPQASLPELLGSPAAGAGRHTLPPLRGVAAVRDALLRLSKTDVSFGVASNPGLRTRFRMLSGSTNIEPNRGRRPALVEAWFDDVWMSVIHESWRILDFRAYHALVSQHRLNGLARALYLYLASTADFSKRTFEIPLIWLQERYGQRRRNGTDDETQWYRFGRANHPNSAIHKALGVLRDLGIIAFDYIEEPRRNVALRDLLTGTMLPVDHLPATDLLLTQPATTRSRSARQQLVALPPVVTPPPLAEPATTNSHAVPVDIAWRALARHCGIARDRQDRLTAAGWTAQPLVICAMTVVQYAHENPAVLAPNQVRAHLLHELGHSAPQHWQPHATPRPPYHAWPQVLAWFTDAAQTALAGSVIASLQQGIALTTTTATADTAAAADASSPRTSSRKGAQYAQTPPYLTSALLHHFSASSGMIRSASKRSWTSTAICVVLLDALRQGRTSCAALMSKPEPGCSERYDELRTWFAYEDHAWAWPVDVARIAARDRLGILPLRERAAALRGWTAHEAQRVYGWGIYLLQRGDDATDLVRQILDEPYDAAWATKVRDMPSDEVLTFALRAQGHARP